MRFRGKLVDISCIQHFTRVVGTIAKLAKVCTLRITKNKMYYILSERLVNGGVSIWCEMSQGHFFNEYAMDGLSSEHDEIYLELVPDSMLRALRTAQNAKSVKLKLTKKQAPALTFEVELPTVSSHTRLVTHDVPVHVIPHRHWEEYDEPEIPQFDISIHLPALKVLRNIVDRMKNVSNYITISANHSGEMKLNVETDLVNIASHFRDLEVHNWDASTSRPAPTDTKQLYSARVDIRKFAQFLSGQQVNPQRVICNIVDERVVHIFLLHDDVSLQYFLPVISA